MEGTIAAGLFLHINPFVPFDFHFCGSPRNAVANILDLATHAHK